MKGGKQMAGTPNLDAQRSKLTSIPQSLVREPNMPVNHIVAEAITLEKIAVKDQDQLSSRKLDWSLVSTLGQRARALQEANTMYMVAQFGTGELKDQFEKALTEAMTLREDLTHGMLYAFDENELLLEAVRSIMQGNSYSDLVQDLSDLEGLGTKHKDLLDSAGIDFKLIDRAGELKIILGDLLATTNVEKMEKSPEKVVRDRAFTYLMEAVEKVRKCGKSVFWKDPDHAAFYASAYMRKQRRKSAKPKNTKEENEELATA